MKLKYIIIDDGLSGQAILFGQTLGHDDVARTFNTKPVSAGFCSFYENEDGDMRVSAYGHSVSLDITPDEERLKKDAKLLTQAADIHMGFH